MRCDRIPSHDDDRFPIHSQSEDECRSEDHTSGRRAEGKSIRVLGLLFPQLGVVYYAMRQREREGTGVAILVQHVILKESYEQLRTIDEKKRCLILKMKQP